MHISPREERRANLIGALALALTDRTHRAVNRADERGLSAPAALQHIHTRPGQTIDSLARVIGISHPAAVRLVDRLEAEGLVERRPGRDGRSRALFLTPRGTRATRAAMRSRLEVLGDALAPLTDDEQARLEPLVEKLLAGLIDDRPTARTVCRLCDFPVCEDPSCPVDVAASATERP